MLIFLQAFVDFIPWCADNTIYFIEPVTKTIPEDPQPEEEEQQEWCADDVVRHHLS